MSSSECSEPLNRLPALPLKTRRYLENQPMVNGYITKAQRELERTVPPLRQSNPELLARLAKGLEV